MSVELYMEPSTPAIWQITDGLLEIEMETWMSHRLIDLLSEKIRSYAYRTDVKPSNFQLIHRASRMCYELSLSNEEEKTSHLTMIDREDAQILYHLPFDEISWLITILNEVRFKLRNTGNISIVAADHFAKSIDITMSD